MTSFLLLEIGSLHLASQVNQDVRPSISHWVGIAAWHVMSCRMDARVTGDNHNVGLSTTYNCNCINVLTY